MRHRQQQAIEKAIPHLASRVHYLSQLPNTPITGWVIANECFDAMPVQRFRIHHSKLEASYVCWEDGQFKEDFQANEDKNMEALLKKAPWIFQIEDYTSEINLKLDHYWNGLSACLSQGVVMVIDYGFPRQEYYHPDRYMGTLMCHYQHRSHSDPFCHIGLQDITAHVDFSAMAEHACAAGFELMGYTSQAHFLLECGLLDHAQEQSTNERTRLALNQAIKLFTFPSEMGELFKVMACAKSCTLETFPGFDKQREL